MHSSFDFSAKIIGKIVVEEAAHEITPSDWKEISAAPYVRHVLGLSLANLLDRAIGVWMNFRDGSESGQVFVLYGMNPKVAKTVLIRKSGRIEFLGEE